MAFDLKSVNKGVVMRAPRIVLLGVEKIGKSTFAAGSANPIFIPIRGEEGIDALDVASFPTCQTFADVMECIGTLYQDEHDYQTVVIDSASALEPLVWARVCERFRVNDLEEVQKGFGRGYIAALDEWRQIQDGLDALRVDRNMASILIGHVKVGRFNDPSGDAYDRYWMDINDKATNQLFRWCDSILFANTKVSVKKEEQGFGKVKQRGVDVTGGQRFLFTQHRPAHPGGGRDPYGKLPYELPLDWQVFMDAVAAASQ